MKISLFVSALIGFIFGLLIMLLLPNSMLFSGKVTATLFSIANAPRQTIHAQIVSFSPDIYWESRVATIPAILTSKIALSQGEEIDTGSGSAILSLSPVGIISLAKNTTLDFIQLLPLNIVLSQSKGSVSYDNSNNGQLGVVVGNLLVQVISGKCSVTVDSKKNTITISVASGNVLAAYNDTNYSSHVQTLAAKQIYIFDNTAQTGVLKKI